jgi:hypothetical protein
MAHDPAAGLGRWRERRGGGTPRSRSPGRANAKKWAGVIVLSTLMMAVAAVGGWIVYQFVFPEAPRPYLCAFWVGEYQQRAAAGRGDATKGRLSPLIPPIPWIDADRKAVQGVKVFTRLAGGEDRTQTPPKEVIEVRLKALRLLKPGDAVVVYLAAYARVDDRGKVQVLAYDSEPYRPETLLPLDAVLGRLKECPARRKLLVLDVMRGTPDPSDLGGTADGVADLVRGELASQADTHLFVLGACSPGQTGLWSEAPGRSVFAHFFGLGLTDPQADTDGDRAVSVKELARYLDRKVDQWAGHYRDASQRPFLHGSGPDFPLASVIRVKPPRRWTWAWKWPPWKASTPPAPGSSEPMADATSEKKADGAKGKGAPAADGKAQAAKGEDAPPLPGGFSYPPWLADGWELREKWWRASDDLASPRVFRRLDAVLLRAERRWRGGDDPDAIRRELAGERSRLEAAMDQARRLPRPDNPVSVGQARALGRTFDQDLTVALKKLLSFPVSQIDAPRKQEFLDKLQGRSSLDLAAAVVDTLADRPFDPKTLDFLDALVTETRLPRDVVELRALSQLSRRARASAGDWTDETAKRAWDVICASESANSLHHAFPWVRDLLGKADGLRHEAEVMSLPQAAGFAPASQTAAKWEQARAVYEQIRTFQERLANARVVRGKALVFLLASIPYAESAGGSDYEAAWFDAAGKVRELDQLLARPDQPLADDPLADRNRSLNDAIGELNRAVAVLGQPFQPDRVGALVESCTSKSVRPAAALSRKVEAVLTGPFLPARARQELWAAGRVLDRRLAELPVDETGTARDPASTGGHGAGTPAERLSRRLRRAAALAALAGKEIDLQMPPRADIGDETRDAVKGWSAVARAFRTAHDRFEELASRSDQDDPLDRLGWVAPAFSVDWQRNPTRQERARYAAAGWAWLAGRYLHQARDLNDTDLPDTVKFFEDAALACANCDPDAPNARGLPPESVIEGGAAPSSGLKLSSNHPDDQVSLQFLLRAAEGNGPQKVALTALKPDDPRLKVSAFRPAELELVPGATGSAVLAAHWDDDAGRPADVSPRGFVVQARVANQSPFHFLVRTDIVSESLRPRLVVGRSPSRPDDIASDRIRLRPVAGRQPFYLFVRNPSPVARDLVVELFDGGSPKPLEAKVKVEPNSSPLVPGFGLPPLKPEERLPALGGTVRIVLRENRPDGAVLDERRLDADIATADDYLTDYLEVARAQFIPANRSAGGKNRLAVTLKALRGLTDPPCKVGLDFPREKALFPALREAPRGTLSGLLMPGGDLPLLVDDIALDPSAPPEGSFYLDIDGNERAVWFRTNFVRDGVEQRAEMDRRPRLRFRHEYDPTAQAARLTVGFVVDNPPEGSKLEARLGRVEGDQFVDDIPRWTAPAKDRVLGFAPRGENGGLLFEAGLKDHEHVFNIPRIRGERVLEARLLDRAGRKELAPVQTLLLTLDDQSPEIVSLVVPKQVVRGTPRLPARGSVVPPASGIKDVVFFMGGKADVEKAKAGGVFAQGQPGASPGRDWEAQVPLPKDVVGPVLVSARFTSGVGLSSFETREVMVLPPPPPPVNGADVEKKKAPPRPGAIQGRVAEGSRAQTGLDVQLYLVDPAGKEAPKVVATTKSGPKGAFAFKAVNPGLYKLFCRKPATNRCALKDVTVEAGKTNEELLELLLCP